MMVSVDLGSVLVLPREERKAPRAYVVGATDTGKSTLMEVLMNEYQIAYSVPKLPVMTLIADTKPRFKAEMELWGVPTSVTRRYSKWGYGSGIIPGSYVIEGKLASFASELDQVWKLGGKIAIVHAEHKNKRESVAEALRVFYEHYGAKRPRLAVVDEVADFYESRAWGSIIEQIARAGRERDLGLIAGSQRPRKVSKELLTEMSRLYMFELQWYEDLKHVMEFGLPRDIRVPTGHTFLMWDRKLKFQLPSNQYYELDLSNNFYTGNIWTGS